MKIVHICKRFSPRVVKLVIAQQMQGHEVKLIYQINSAPGMFQHVNSSTQWVDRGTLSSKVFDNCAGADIAWIHTSINDRGLFGACLRDISLQTAMVWDIHDVVDHDQDMLEKADIVLAPSKAFEKRLQKQAPKAYVKTLYNKCPAAFKSTRQVQKIENSCILASDVEPPVHGSTVWRDYFEIKEDMRKAEIPLFVYPASNPNAINRYYEFIMAPLPVDMLIERMSAYSFGWAGAGNNRHRIDDCVTNKFWEYLAAGIPVATFRSDEMRDLAEEVEVGFDIEKINLSTLMTCRRKEHHNAENLPDELIFLEGDKTYMELCRK